MDDEQRKKDLKVFYGLISRLPAAPEYANNGNGSFIEFAFQRGETRRDTGKDGQKRVVRVGTSDNPSRRPGSRKERRGGESYFREHLKLALMTRMNQHGPREHFWRHKKAAERKVNEMMEKELEFRWLPVKKSDVAFIKTKCIALLSNYERTSIDVYSKNWLGMWCRNANVRESGLWNDHYVAKKYRHSPKFLKKLAELVGEAEGK